MPIEIVIDDTKVIINNKVVECFSFNYEAKALVQQLMMFEDEEILSIINSCN